MEDRGCGRPSLKQLNDHVLQKAAVKWRYIGIQLLIDSSALDIIKENHKQDVHHIEECCYEMFKKWLETSPNPSWNHLLEALKSPSVELIHLANQIEQKLISPPVVTHHPTSSSDVPVGRSVTLTCGASGLGSVEYSWERSSGNKWTTVSNDNGTTSYTTETKLAIGQYMYRCRVSNEAGSVMSNIAIVNMYGSPVVTHHPTSSCDVLVGRSVTLTCVASGLGTVVYSWERSSGSNWTTVSNDNTTSYTTDTTLAIGQYLYRCRVSNEAGSVMTNIAIVNTYGPPVVTHHPTSSSDVPVGRSITLTCVASGLGTVVYSWERSSGSNWTTVSNDNTTSCTTDTTLAIGQYLYRCRLSNEAGSVVSNIAIVNTYGPPVVTHHPTSSCDVLVGRSITLTCVASGLGTVGYFWERSSGSNWTTVSNDNGTTSYTTDTTLAIGQYMYRCRVSNEAGSVVSNITIVNVNDVSSACPISTDYDYTTCLDTEDQQRHATQDVAKKGKDCLTVAKNALDDIGSGREEMALRKFSALQTDGRFLADTAKQLAEQLEAANKFYQQKDAEILHEIGELSRRESELKDQKSREEIQLAEYQNVLQDNQIRLCSEENKIQEAEEKLRKAIEREKDVQLKSILGGAVLGLIARKVGVAEGAAAGAGIGVIINNYKKEEKNAQDEVDRCRSELDSARSAVNEGQRRISNIESQIMSLDIQINYIKQQYLQLHTKHLQLPKEIDKVRVLIDLAKRSVTFWLLFEQISEHGVDHTTLLQNIITMAAETGDYQSKGNTFIEAWEQMTMECEGSNYIPQIEYK